MLYMFCNKFIVLALMQNTMRLGSGITLFLRVKEMSANIAKRRYKYKNIKSYRDIALAGDREG